MCTRAPHHCYRCASLRWLMRVRHRIGRCHLRRWLGRCRQVSRSPGRGRAPCYTGRSSCERWRPDGARRARCSALCLLMFGMRARFEPRTRHQPTNSASVAQHQTGRGLVGDRVRAQISLEDLHVDSSGLLGSEIERRDDESSNEINTINVAKSW